MVLDYYACDSGTGVGVGVYATSGYTSCYISGSEIASDWIC